MPAMVYMILILGIIMSGCVGSSGHYDVLVKNGTIIDGTGKPRFVSNIGIIGEYIEFIGQGEKGVTWDLEIDAEGLVVAPGFIDVHNHALDVLVETDPKEPHVLPQYLTQGVTTVVTGADGYWSPNQIRMIKQRLSELGSGVNYGCYVGHNGVRQEVLGDDQNRAPTEQELGRMRSLTAEGMKEGCFGLSTGLMYQPGVFSKTDEVIALAEVISIYGGIYDSHVRDPANRLLESDQEAIAIGKSANIPVRIAHLKAVGMNNAGRMDDVIALIKKARSDGQDVVSDQYPYDGTGLTRLAELILFPGIEQLYQKGDEKLIVETIKQTISDPARRDELKQYAEHGVNGGFSWLGALGYGSYRIKYSENYPELEGKIIQALADERVVDPFDLIVELLIGADQPIHIIGAIEEEDVQKLLVQPWNMIASDGFYVYKEGVDINMHPRGTGTFPRLLGRYVRELGIISLEEAVRKITSFPADHLGMKRRGRLVQGAIADIVIFDPNTISDRSTWKRPTLFSKGVHYVLVNGSLALNKEVVTGVTKGKFVSK